MAEAAQPLLTPVGDGHDDSLQHHDSEEREEEGDGGRGDILDDVNMSDVDRNIDMPCVYVLQTRHVLAAVGGEMKCA